LDGGGFRPAFQLKQQLPGFDRVTACHGQVRQRAAERRRHVNIFALDVALKDVRGIQGTTSDK
jgi:hypothetical protein